MEIIRRPPTDAERRALLQSRPLLRRLFRPGISGPATPAEVEVLRFPVHRAWKGITCFGPPCCPNTWLLETSDRTFVWLQSWAFLTAADEQFPGSDVTLVCRSESNEIITASAAGIPAPTRPGNESLVDFEGAHQVEVYGRDALPDALARALDV
jgi:hypothetical protein